MDAQSVIQLSGNTIALLFLVRELLVLILHLRGGAPEMKIIREQVTASNTHIETLLAQLIESNRELSGRSRRSSARRQ